MKIGNAIKEYRRGLGMRQVDLRKKLGISHNHLSLIENGKMVPRPDTLLAIAGAMKIPVIVLFLLSMEETDVKGKGKELWRKAVPALRVIAYELVK